MRRLNLDLPLAVLGIILAGFAINYGLSLWARGNHFGGVVFIMIGIQTMIHPAQFEMTWSARSSYYRKGGSAKQVEREYQRVMQEFDAHD